MTEQIVKPNWEKNNDFYREEINKIIDRHKIKKGSLIKILQQSQNMVGFLDPEMLEIIAERLDIPVIQIYSVVTFYNFFSMLPKGKYTIQVCTGTSCYVKGSKEILEAFEKNWG